MLVTLLLLASGLAGAQPLLRDPSLGEFRALVHLSNPAHARRVLNARIQKSVRAGDKTAEMHNRYVLGGLLHRWRRFVEAGRELERALALADSLERRWLANRIRTALASIAEARGMPHKARQHLSARTSSPTTVDDALAMVVVARLETDAGERIALLREALQIVRTAQPHVRFREAELLQAIGTTCMAAADYQCALEHSRQAGEMFNQLGARRKLIDVLRIEGLLQFEHGRYREAEIVFRRIWQTELLANDRSGDQRTQAMLAVTLAKLGKPQDAIEILEKTVEILKGRKSAQARFSFSIVAIGYSEIGEHQKAVEIFERLLQAGRLQSMLAGYLAQSYFHLARYRDAIDAATKGFAERSADPEEDGGSRDSRSLWWRALAREKLGETENALQDAIHALDVMEQARERLVQSDFMKRGFADRGKEIVDFVVELAFRQKRYSDAFAVAERARGRAFLDLLASREGTPSARVATTSESTRLSRFLSRLGDPIVASETYSKPASAEQMVQTVKRLQSTLLAYWVTADVTYVWTLDANGELHAAHHRIRESDLRTLVDRIRKRSDTADRAAWRALHAALIEPVRAWLSKANSLITVVPHGPLFDVPFAALSAASGRYLIEDFRLHYASSASVLEFTKSEQTAVPPRFLVVADPAKPPPLPDGKPLPPLPASRREARAIGTTVSPANITVLQGPQALLEAVREGAASASVLHFATHAVVQPERPLESFLALADGQRLTAADVYEMNLPSSLVVLSACRSASGPISSDGVLGLSRAFFAAGASSVIASVWDVPDEPASLLMAEFYKHLRTSRPGEALRAAQIAIVQRLRDGKLTVGTSAGPAILPEHPMLWAGFELMGEP